MNKEFTYYSLFSGIGGMTMGLEPLGGTCLGAWEFDPTEKKTQFAQEAHRLLHPHIPIHGDVTKIIPEELDDFDVLCFTPPCQSFSFAGERKGFDDTRGTLTFDALRVAKVKRPKILFMENVKGMLSHDKGSTMSTICHAFNEIGYCVDFTILNSKYFDVTQNRERLYLIAVRKDLIKQEDWKDIKGTTVLHKVKQKLHNEGVQGFNFDYPKEEEVKCKLADFLESDVDEKYYISEERELKLLNKLNDKNKEKFKKINSTRIIQLNGDRDNAGLSVNNEHAYCIPANPMSDRGQLLQEWNGVNYRIRKLTPTECLNLQSIDKKYIELLNENFSESRLLKFAGNGLTTNVIRAIGNKIVTYL